MVSPKKFLLDIICIWWEKCQHLPIWNRALRLRGRGESGIQVVWVTRLMAAKDQVKTKRKNKKFWTWIFQQAERCVCIVHNQWTAVHTLSSVFLYWRSRGWKLWGARFSEPCIRITHFLPFCISIVMFLYFVVLYFCSGRVEKIEVRSSARHTHFLPLFPETRPTLI